jgi:predicted HAD superfamily Cof-like phosphohydrolase
MNKEQLQVRDFHRAFNILEKETPTIPDEKTKILRMNLIKEEVAELEEAFNNNDIIKIADGIADILYVVYGTAISCGLDMEPLFQEVHRSNMTKIGGYKRKDGKWIKPDTYEKADLWPIIMAQNK